MSMHTYALATVDISEDADLTNAVDIRGYVTFALLVPSTLNGTEIKLHVSYDNATYYPLYSASNAHVAHTITASTAQPLSSLLPPWPWMKIETTTDQADTDTEFVVVMSS